MKYLFILLNLFLSFSCFFVSNEFLRYNGYLIFLLQFLINLYFLFITNKVTFNQFFIPSLFSYLYLSINMILGGYLVPRGFGFFKDYQMDVLKIQNYNLFTPYIIFALFILAFLSYKSVKFSNFFVDFFPVLNRSNNKFIFIVFSLYIITLFIGLPVAFQIGLLIIFFYYSKGNLNILLKYLLYLIIIMLSLNFYSIDKRNILIVLFVIVFFETVDKKNIIKINLKNILILSISFILFLFLIISASINRGYGGYEIITFWDLLISSINYTQTDFFLDAITDNLELNYNYGASLMALEYVQIGRINYQFGLTLIKPIFILIPREIYPDKPYSFMHLFTQQYTPLDWKRGSSLPVIFPVELYGNFHYLGLVALFFFYTLFNKMYVYIIKNFKKLNFKTYSCVFFIITHLYLIRGGGLDLYILYFIFSIPFFFILKRFRNFLFYSK